METFSLITILVGLMLLVLGYLIRFHQMVEIIAGYDPNKVIDKEGLANWVGSNLLLMGLMILFLASLSIILPELSVMQQVLGVVATILILSLRAATGCKKYEK